MMKSARAPTVPKFTLIVSLSTAVTEKLLLAKLKIVLGEIPDAEFDAESDLTKQIMLLSTTESLRVPGVPAKAKVSVPVVEMVI